jgi:hypothetical protein
MRATVTAGAARAAARARAARSAQAAASQNSGSELRRSAFALIRQKSFVRAAGRLAHYILLLYSPRSFLVSDA